MEQTTSTQQNLTTSIQKAIGKMMVLKNHGIVIENINTFWNGEMDVMSISKSEMIHEFEVKISRADFKADLKKRKWFWHHHPAADTCPNYFSYCCPNNLIKLDEVPVYCGLYYYSDNKITEVKKPKRIHKEKVADINRIKDKVLRLMSERLFLGCARLTYQNNAIKERNKTRNLTQY